MTLKKNLKKLIIIIFLIIILFFLFNYFLAYHYIPYKGRKHFNEELENIANNNQIPIFKVSNLLLHSDIYVESNDSSTPSYTWNINLNQYTDIAIYIEKLQTTETFKNTIKSLYIDEINFSEPSKGIPILYYKNPFNFGKYIMNDNNKIEDSFEFKIVTKSDDISDFSYPYFYNDCANPLTLSYINKNIIKDYNVPDNVQSLVFNGHILSNLQIPVDNLSATCTFNINIINYLDEHYKCPITFEIPLKTNEKTITEGKITKTLDVDEYFYHL